MKLTSLILTVSALFLLNACSSNKKVGEKTYHSEYYMQNSDSISQKVCPANAVIQKQIKLESLMKSANGCVKNKNWTKVSVIGNKILEKYTQTPWGAYFLSLQAENMGQSQRALWMMDLAIKKSPNMGVLYYQKARLLWSTKQVYESVNMMKKALEIDDTLMQAHLFMGNLYTRDHLYDKAFKHYKKVLDDDSDNYQALLGVAEYYVVKNDKENAEKYLNEVLSENPKNLVARIKLAKVYESNFQDYKQAITMYERATRYHSSTQILSITGLDVNTKLKDLNALWKKQKETQRKVSSTSVPKNKGVKK